MIIDGRVPVPSTLLAGGRAAVADHFVLRVVGDGMKEDGLRDVAAKQEEYCAFLALMHDAALETEAERKIWPSGFAENNPRSCYHWHADACYDEAKRREKPEIYKRAYDKVLAEAS